MDKRNVYDWDTKIHLLARGPGITHGSTWIEPATQVDMAPTFLGLAGARNHPPRSPLTPAHFQPPPPHPAPSSPTYHPTSSPTSSPHFLTPPNHSQASLSQCRWMGNP
jgi:hypothetical protein